MSNNKPYYDDIPGYEGQKFDRVTGVLDYFQDKTLIKWREKVGKEEASRISGLALKVGSRVDDLVKRFVTDRTWKLRKTELIEVVNCVEGYQQWLREYPYLRITGVERRVFEPGIKVAGTIDLEAVDERDGSGILLDLKCSSYVAPKYWLQVGTYNSFLATPHKHIGIVRLHKSLAFCDYKLRAYDPVYRQVFNGLLAAYRFYQSENRSEMVEPDDDRSNSTHEETGEEAGPMEYSEISHTRTAWRWEI